MVRFKIRSSVAFERVVGGVLLIRCCGNPTVPLALAPSFPPPHLWIYEHSLHINIEYSRKSTCRSCSLHEKAVLSISGPAKRHPVFSAQLGGEKEWLKLVDGRVVEVDRRVRDEGRYAGSVICAEVVERNQQIMAKGNCRDIYRSDIWSHAEEWIRQINLDPRFVNFALSR